MGTKSQTASTETPFDMEGVVNTENPVESLGTLDLGDDVEPGQEGPVEEPEVEEASAEEPEEEEEEPEEDPEAEEPEEEPEEDPEAEEEPEEEPEAEEEEEPEAEAEKPAKKEPAIPKSRFDQRTAQLRAAERELEQMRTQLREVETARQRAEREANTMSDEQLQAKMTEANAALIEGDTEKAAKLQAEVFGAIRQGQQATEGEGQSVDPAKIAADVRDQITFETTLKTIAEKYPALDDQSELFDEAISEEAVGFQKMYFDQGYTRAEATEKAANAVAKIHGLDTTEPAAPAPKTSKKAAMAKKTQTASRKAKVAAARRAPPPAGGDSGANADSADSIDLDSITVEDWAALPDSVRSRLMGDAG